MSDSGAFTWTGGRAEWAAAVALIADIGALISIWRSRLHSRKAKTVWTLLVLLIPLIGALSWFALGREPRYLRRKK